MMSCIFEGRLKHRRYTPVEHEFEYRLFMLYLDLAELDDVFRGRWLWSVKRPAFARFRRSDHLGDPDQPLDESVRDLVQERTCLLYTSPSPRDGLLSRMPSSA